ncbi:hypothetical protein G5I_09104 [Acromyrmex echinatior]|uniref:Uncharacterized protein n=1 Tax=Acromyrmex echinatior TaxID=103372 RepID=F4WTE6_ACREC|nr:hypothetical protein G5I_09104 [Acromyrmex echinatior]
MGRSEKKEDKEEEEQKSTEQRKTERRRRGRFGLIVVVLNTGQGGERVYDVWMKQSGEVTLTPADFSSECGVCPCESARRDFSRRDVKVAKVFAEVKAGVKASQLSRIWRNRNAVRPTTTVQESWEEKRRKIAPHHKRTDVPTPRRSSRSRSGRNEIPDRASVVHYRDDDLARKGIADATIYAHRLTPSSFFSRGEWHISLRPIRSAVVTQKCIAVAYSSEIKRVITPRCDDRDGDEVDERVRAHFPSRRSKRVSSPAITKGYHHRTGKFAFADPGRGQMPTICTKPASDAGSFSMMDDKQANTILKSLLVKYWHDKTIINGITLFITFGQYSYPLSDRSYHPIIFPLVGQSWLPLSLYRPPEVEGNWHEKLTGRTKVTNDEIKDISPAITLELSLGQCFELCEKIYT